MPNIKPLNKPERITQGDVLEDLGFSAAEIREMEIKHDLWSPIRVAIDAKKLTQAQVAKRLEIHQPDASLLLRGQLARFSITRLLQFAERLDLRVKLSVTPAKSSLRRAVRSRAPQAARPARAGRKRRAVA